ncbi:MAG: aldo/keto reductase [Phototrophicales bacterium]|nr:MAG: aldo/keto reductase [Phototrophicales bacterium]
MPILGHTGLKVSRIGLGLAALGRPAYINLGHADDLDENYQISAMEAHTHRVLDAAWKAGIRYFDAARSYGRAEAFLGSWLKLRKIDPQSVTVGSKWGYIYTANWQIEAEVHEVKEHSVSVLRQQWAETQEFLGKYLDVYQIHSATFESGVLENQAVLDDLARLKNKGIKIGLTLSGTQQSEVLLAAIEILRDGQHLFDTVQITWNIFESSASKAIETAHEVGMGVIIKEALANGRLTARNNAPEFATKRSVLEEQAQRFNASIDAIALAYVLHQKWADVVLSGAARVDHLQSNIKALEIELDTEAIEALKGLAEPPEQYWQTRSALAWN